jgi:membrane protein implicated in regulation of membrane protease activity
MDSPEDWRWVWVAATAIFAIGEMATVGSFVLAPFAVGALVAALLAFAGVGVVTEWLAFIVVSIAALVAMRPLARRLNRNAIDDGVGARRLVGSRATVLQAIPGGAELGMAMVDREEWRAQSIDDAPIPEGTTVRVADVQGTRVIVAIDSTSAGTAEPPTGTTDPTDEPHPPGPGGRSPDSP